MNNHYCIAAKGNSEHFRRVADAQDKCLKPFFSGPGWEFNPGFFESIPTLRQDHAIKNNGLGGVQEVAFFIAGWFAGKLCDQLYERTLKRPINEFLDTLLSKSVPPTGRPIELRDVIFLEDIKTVVVIRVLVRKENIAEVALLLPKAHRAAYDYIRRNGTKASIHCHSITNGQVNLQPELFDSLDEINNHDSKSRGPSTR